MDNPLFKKSDVIVILALLALAGLLLLPKAFNGGDAVAIITKDNEIIEEIDLKSSENKKITLDSVEITVENGEIFFSKSDCEDKVCVKTGKLSSPGDAAACVPNGTAIYIKGESEVDAVAY